jgi:hypothetical protein
VSEKIATIKIKAGKLHCCNAGVHAPVEGKTGRTEVLYTQLQESINMAGKKDDIIFEGN